MQRKTFNLYKPIGTTPLELIEKFKELHSEYQNQKLGYAGRLDPMAEGLLLVLVGDENKKRKEYEKLTKEYEFDVLFGIKTDSYDVLGKITGCSPCHAELVPASKKDEILKRVQNDIHEYLGKHLQEYPPYSSPRVKGKPLFWWAREGKLSEIEIPRKEIEIYGFKILKTYELKSKELQKTIFERILKVKGEFRQEEISKGWDDFFTKNPNTVFSILKFSISCSSGTYVRSIANELGGIALNIKRVKVGKYIVEDSMKV